MIRTYNNGVMMYQTEYLARTRFFYLSPIVAISAMVISLWMAPVAWSDETTGLKLPEDIAARESGSDSESVKPVSKYSIEESRIGGRLERVTVRRSNGFDEVYENKEVDSMWATEEKELGEVPNMRRWTLGTW
jgi:hypothetical protein